MQKLRWGVIGTAKIATTKVIPGIRRSATGVVQAIASRDLGRARAAAADLGIPRAHGSYEALLADPEVDAVYVALPNHLHVAMSLRAAEAGKHVLCEKPVALDAAEAEKLRAIAGRVVFMEAFMVRAHPQWHRVRDLVAEGRVGEVRAVQVAFAYANLDPANIRNVAAYGGGALMDIGCYAVVAGRYVFGAEPRRAVALVDRDPGFGTDRTTSGLLDFGGGRQLAFTVSTQMAPHQRVQILGTKGRIEVPIPFNAPQAEEVQVILDDGSRLARGSEIAETIPAADQYGLQADLFARAVRGEGQIPFGVEDAIANMRVIDALFRSERSGAWETIDAG